MGVLGEKLAYLADGFVAIDNRHTETLLDDARYQHEVEIDESEYGFCDEIDRARACAKRPRAEDDEVADTANIAGDENEEAKPDVQLKRCQEQTTVHAAAFRADRCIHCSALTIDEI